MTGMLADFVVLDRDPTASSPDKLLATKVLRTVVGGKTVYEAEVDFTATLEYSGSVLSVGWAAAYVN